MPATAWTGKAAAICGASEGLGLELAKQLAAQSVASLLLLARNEQRLQATAAELRSNYPHIDINWLSVDMSSRDAVRAVAAQRTACPPLDLLIQAVGKSDRGSLRDLTKEHMLELFDANLFSSLNAVNDLTVLMARPSTLVLVGSLASHFAPRFLGGYAIAKHAVAALAQQSRLELQEEGVHVMLASPGPISRPDAGKRYHSPAVAASVPSQALEPGGGARLRGLDPSRLAQEILRAAHRRKALVIFPPKARWLRILSALAPQWGDRLLRQNSS